MNWYTLRVISGKEKKVKESILFEVKNAELDNKLLFTVLWDTPKTMGTWNLLTIWWTSSMFFLVNIEGINSGTLSISNMIGERVLFQDASVDDFGNINLENLPAGLYMLTISSENKISTIKVVKK